jgi:hypothetical protein
MSGDQLIAIGEKASQVDEEGRKEALKDQPADSRTLIVQMFVGTCKLKGALPSWHVIKHQHQENQDAIVCTKCWTYTQGGQPLTAAKAGPWFYECNCPQSYRSAVIME